MQWFYILKPISSIETAYRDNLLNSFFSDTIRRDYLRLVLIIFAYFSNHIKRPFFKNFIIPVFSSFEFAMSPLFANNVAIKTFKTTFAHAQSKKRGKKKRVFLFLLKAIIPNMIRNSIYMQIDDVYSKTHAEIFFFSFRKNNCKYNSRIFIFQARNENF